MSVAQIVAGLIANANAYHEGRVDHAQFSARQGELWGAAVATPEKHKAVTDGVREWVQRGCP